MRKEAASAGFYLSGWRTDHPKIQPITFHGFLEGKRIDHPPSREVDETFRKALKAKTNKRIKNQDLFSD